MGQAMGQREEVLAEARMAAVKLVMETEETEVAEALTDGVVSLDDLMRAMREAIVEELALDEERA